MLISNETIQREDLILVSRPELGILLNAIENLGWEEEKAIDEVFEAARAFVLRSQINREEDFCVEV